MHKLKFKETQACPVYHCSSFLLSWGCKNTVEAEEWDRVNAHRTYSRFHARNVFVELLRSHFFETNNEQKNNLISASFIERNMSNILKIYTKLYSRNYLLNGMCSKGPEVGIVPQRLLFETSLKAKKQKLVNFP